MSSEFTINYKERGVEKPPIVPFYLRVLTEMFSIMDKTR